MKRLLTLLLLLPLTTVADDAAEDAATLTVKPLLCIVDARTPSCDIRFAIAWRAAATGYYCVHNDFEAAALRCWVDARLGELQDHRTVVESFRYWLNHGEDRPALATATVEVLRKDSDDRRRRRRTRHVWDVY